jgi:cytochrome b561
MSRSSVRYDGVAIALHWVMAVLLVGDFAWGWWMQQIPKSPPGVRADAFNLHKSFGLLLLALAVLRLGWRLFHRPPPPAAMPRWQWRVATANHGLMYATLILLPLAGYLGSVASGYPVKVFGFVLPAWGAKDDAIKAAMSAVHLGLSWVLAAAVSLHVAASVKHVVVDRDGLLQRMLPGRAAERSG